MVCVLSELETDRRPWALRSWLLRSLSRSFTSLNRKKTSLHSGWVSNNLRRRQREHRQKSEIRPALVCASSNNKARLIRAGTSFLPESGSVGFLKQRVEVGFHPIREPRSLQLSSFRLTQLQPHDLTWFVLYDLRLYYYYCYC